MTVFAVNRDTTRPMSLTAGSAPGAGHRPVEHVYLADADRHACNTVDNQNRVAPRQGDTVRVEKRHAAGRAAARCPGT